MGAPAKFPNPRKFGLDDAVVFCSRDKMLQLYNQAEENKQTQAKALGEAVQKWFAATAQQKGWIACWPIKDVDKQTAYAGCALFNGFVGRIQNGEIILPFPHDSEDLETEDETASDEDN